MFKKALSLMLVGGLMIGGMAQAEANSTLKLIGSLAGGGGLYWAGDKLKDMNTRSAATGNDDEKATAAWYADGGKAVLIPLTVALGCYLYLTPDEIPSYMAKIGLYTGTYFLLANDNVPKLIGNAPMLGGLFTDGVDANGKERSGYSRHARVVLGYFLAKELIKLGLKDSPYSKLLD